MKFRFIKGNHYMHRRKLTPGEIVECDPSEVKSFMDRFEPAEAPPPEPEPEVGLKVVAHVEGGNTFDVVNETTGKPVNDVPLTLDEARQVSSTTNVDTSLLDQMEKDGELHPVSIEDEETLIDEEA